MDALEIVARPSETWTDAEKTAVLAATAPIVGKTVKEMTDGERDFVRALFVAYYASADPKRRAIAYTVIMGGVPASKIGEMQLIETHGGQSPIAQRILASPGSVYCKMMMINTAHDSKTTYLDVTLRRVIVLDGDCWTLNYEPFNKAMIDYIENVRGIVPGPLFTQDRKAKGKDYKPPVSTATVGRILRKAAQDLGFGGAGQHLQFHRLAYAYDAD